MVVLFFVYVLLGRWDRWDRWDKWKIPIERSVTHQAKRSYLSYQRAERVIKGIKGYFFYPSDSFRLLSREINFLLEGVRLGLSQKKTPRDSTQTYRPRGLTFSDGPRMTPYHKKLLGVGNGACLSNNRNLHLTRISHLILNLLSDIV